MKPNPVAWFEIYVDDMDRARKFYESVFQTKLTKMSNGDLEMWAFPMEQNTWGAAGTLVKLPGPAPKGNSVLVYFTADDCAVEEKRVVSSGGKIHKPKMSIGEYGFISLAMDSEGNMFGIHSRK